MVFLVFSENVYQKDPESTWHVSSGHMFVFWSEEFAAFMLHGRRFLKAFKFLDSAKLLYEGHFDDSHFSAFHHKTSQLSCFDLITNYIMNHNDVYSVRIYIYICIVCWSCMYVACGHEYDKTYIHNQTCMQTLYVVWSGFPAGWSSDPYLARRNLLAWCLVSHRSFSCFDMRRMCENAYIVII